MTERETLAPSEKPGALAAPFTDAGAATGMTRRAALRKIAATTWEPAECPLGTSRSRAIKPGRRS